MALNAGQVAIGLELDDQKFTTRLKKSAAALDKLGSSALKFSAPLVAGMTGASTALAKFGQEALRVGGGFESAMTRVGAVAGANADELDRLTVKARELGATLPIMAQEAAGAMEVLASRGYDAGKILNTVGDIVNLSIGQNYDLAGSADQVSAALINFQLAEDQAGRVADIFTEASNRSALSMEKLSYAMRYAAAPAAAMGESLESSVAAMGALADAGLASMQIGTTLRGVYGTLASNAEVLGVATRDAEGKLRSLADAMSEISTKGYGLDKFSKAFGVEVATGALILSKSVDKIKGLNNDLSNSFGATAAQVEKQMQTWENVSKSFASRVESLYLTVFDQIKESSKTGVSSLTDLTGALEEWVKKTEVAGKSLEAFVRGLGFEVPDGAGIKEILDSIDIDAIIQKFENAGEMLGNFGRAITDIAQSVPWGLLLNNLDLVMKAGFWSWVIGKGASFVSMLGVMGSKIGGLSATLGGLAKATQGATVATQSLAVISTTMWTTAAERAAFAATDEFIKLNKTIQGNRKSVAILKNALHELENAAVGFGDAIVNFFGGPVQATILGTVAIVGVTATSMITGIYNDIQKIAKDAEKKAREAEDYLQNLQSALEAAEKGEFGGDWTKINNEAPREALKNQIERAEAAKKEYEFQKQIGDELIKATESVRDAKDPLGMKVALVNLEAAQQRAQELLGTVSENSDVWRSINGLITVSNDLLVRRNELIAESVPKPPDFSEYNKALNDLSKETKDKLSKGIKDGLTDKNAIKVYEKVLSSKISETYESIKNKYDETTAEIWKESAERSLGLDEQSQELNRFRQEIVKARGEILTYQQYLRQTGNTSEYAAKQLQEMTNALVEQEFSKLDATGKQQLIDELEELGRQAGGEYAKALADQLKGGTKKAVEDAKKIAAEAVPSQDEILKAIEEKQAGGQKKERKQFTKAEQGLTIDIKGQIVALTGAEVAAYKAGDQQVMKAVEDRQQAIIDIYAAQEAERQRIQEEADRAEAERQKRLGMGSVDTAMPEPDKLLGTFTDALSKSTETGAQMWTKLSESYYAQAATSPLTIPDVQINTESMMNGVIQQFNDATPTLTMALSQVMNGIDLMPAGLSVGKTFTDGLTEALDSADFINGFADKLYQMVSARLQKEMSAAGGVQ